MERNINDLKALFTPEAIEARKRQARENSLAAFQGWKRGERARLALGEFRPDEWKCDMCHNMNSDQDAECQWCEGEGF